MESLGIDGREGRKSKPRTKTELNWMIASETLASKVGRSLAEWLRNDERDFPYDESKLQQKSSWQFVVNSASAIAIVGDMRGMSAQ